jgi:single-stranded-DNA-specific exonuclease
MKKIVLKQNCIKDVSGVHNYLSDYLVTLGIPLEKTSSFIIAPAATDIDDPWKLDNMQQGITMLHDALANNEKIYLQPDCDVDGFTSAAIFYSFVKEIAPNASITYKLHSAKDHGIKPDAVPDDCSLVVIPDAGSMQVDEQKELLKRGKKILILDHHEMDDLLKAPFDIRLCIINNQDSKGFSNKYLSGAGIVFMFIRAYVGVYCGGNHGIDEKYMDLAALGIISDMMDTRTLGNNYIIFYGLNNIRNKMFQALLLKQSYSIPDAAHPSKIDIAFYIAPLINGLIRSGEQDEKEALFSAMLSNNDNRIIESEFRGEKRSESVYQYAARIAANAKSRQDNAKKRSSEFLRKKIDELKLNDNKVIAVKLEENELDKLNPTLTGLTAMELVKTYNKPSLVLRKTNIDGKELYCGSGRSKEFDGLSSFMDFIRSTHDADFVEGHGNAFGVWFTEEGYKKFLTDANEKLKNVDFTNETYEVDYWFKNRVNTIMLTDFAKAIKVYGAGIPQPKFAFTIDLDGSAIKRIGPKNNTLRINYNGITFIMFSAEETLDQIKPDEFYEVNIVGRSQINNYMGKESTQIVIDGIELKTTQKKLEETGGENMKSLEDLI